MAGSKRIRLNKISEDTYEVFSTKRKIKMDVPIQVGCAVYVLDPAIADVLPTQVELV